MDGLKTTGESRSVLAADIRKFVMEELLEDATIPGDPIEQGLLDSLALEMLLDHIQMTYGIELEEEDLVAENFTSIDRVAEVLEQKLARG